LVLYLHFSFYRSLTIFTDISTAVSTVTVEK
jgi:hypothetical protein